MYYNWLTTLSNIKDAYANNNFNNTMCLILGGKKYE